MLFASLCLPGGGAAPGADAAAPPPAAAARSRRSPASWPGGGRSLGQFVPDSLMQPPQLAPLSSKHPPTSRLDDYLENPSKRESTFTDAGPVKRIPEVLKGSFAGEMTITEPGDSSWVCTWVSAASKTRQTSTASDAQCLMCTPVQWARSGSRPKTEPTRT